MTKNGKRILIAAMVIVSLAGTFIGYKILRTTLVLLGVKKEMGKINADQGKSRSSFLTLPMVKKYDTTEINVKALSAASSKAEEDLLEITKDIEQECMVTAQEITREYNLKDDWYSHSEYLTPPETENNTFDLQKPCIHFKESRDFSSILQTLIRLSFAKEEYETGGKLLQSTIAHGRHYISLANEQGGCSLIDAMMAIAILNNTKNAIMKAKLFEKNTTHNLFPIIKKAFIASDNLFPIVGPSLKVERSLLPSFFAGYNKRSATDITMPSIAVEMEWLQEQLDYYFADEEVFSLSYAEAKPKLAIYSERIMKSTDSTAGKDFLLRTLFSPFKAAVSILLTISVPDYSKAYMRECECRSDLRAMYLAFALKQYRLTSRYYPDHLKSIESLIEPHMIIDPYTGKEFTYRKEENTAFIESVRDSPERSLVIPLK